jgi:hypothetical protein
MDPSMVLGFYCKDEQDFDQFCIEIEVVNAGKTPLFSIEETMLDLNKIGQEIASDDDF